ncbi:hypothetical protein CPB97_002715, partial [Podila verticillata]
LLSMRVAHRPGEVIEIMTPALSTCPKVVSYELNLQSPRQLARQDILIQSTSNSPPDRDIFKQPLEVCQDYVKFINAGQKEQTDHIRGDSQKYFSVPKASVAEDHDIQQQMSEMRQPMPQMQQQVLDQPAIIQGQKHALPRQTSELHEYPIPRLFIVLPEETATSDHASTLNSQFRLYFLCECSEHTKVLSSDNTCIPHHIHLAKHEGYDLQRPNEFFQMYGWYMLTVLEMIKYGVTIPGFIVPTLSTVNASGSIQIFEDSLNIISESDINQSIKYLQQFASNISVNQGSAKVDEANSFTRLDALEGADLQYLKDFINGMDQHHVPGNLYRIVTQQGHVKWVCIDHYRLLYKELEEQALANIVKANGGIYQLQLGKVSITLGSTIRAAEFFDALAKARHVDDLDISFDWNCSRSDLEAFENALKNLRVSILRLDLQQCQTSLTRKLFSKSTRHEVLLHIIEHSNVKTIHIVLPKDIVKLSSLPPKAPTHLRKLSFEIRSLGWIGALELYQSLKTNSTLTSLHLVGTSIGDYGAQAMSEALKTNSTLTSLDLTGNSIRDYGALALSTALKTNSTLATLDIRDNLIWFNGFLALAEAVRTNSTMTTLDVRGNLIGDNSAFALSDALRTDSIMVTLDLYHKSIDNKGARALSKAINTNSTLMTLDLGSNSIGDNGVVALSEALKSNINLTSIDFRVNSIGDNGALALSEALKNNSTLTTLNLGWNFIKDNGALALSEALKINSTLTMLYLSSNSIGFKGAQAMSEALKANSSLTTLYLGSNTIGDGGAQALSEALKTNSTLTTLDLYHNLIGDKAAQALSEALKTNSTLTTLYLGWNSIADTGILALTEALETNSTLVTLYLVGNSIGDNGVRALYQLSKTSRCEIMHGVQFDLSRL